MKLIIRISNEVIYELSIKGIIRMLFRALIRIVQLQLNADFIKMLMVNS